MKSKIHLTSTVITILLFVLISINWAATDPNVEKAKNLMDNDKYTQAMQILNKRLSGNPNDAEALFQLGICYMKLWTFKIKQGQKPSRFDFKNIKGNFDKAVNLNDDYRKKAGLEFMRLGVDEINTTDDALHSADDFFDFAIEYDSDLMTPIAKKLFNHGIAHIDRLVYSNFVFSMALRNDKKLGDEICDALYSQGKLYNAEKKLKYFQKASKYCDKYDAIIYQANENLPETFSFFGIGRNSTMAFATEKLSENNIKIETFDSTNILHYDRNFDSKIGWVDKRLSSIHKENEMPNTIRKFLLSFPAGSIFMRKGVNTMFMDRMSNLAFSKLIDKPLAFKIYAKGKNKDKLLKLLTNKYGTPMQTFRKLNQKKLIDLYLWVSRGDELSVFYKMKNPEIEIVFKHRAEEHNSRLKNILEKGSQMDSEAF